MLSRRLTWNNWFDLPFDLWLGLFLNSVMPLSLVVSESHTTAVVQRFAVSCIFIQLQENQSEGMEKKTFAEKNGHIRPLSHSCR